MNIELQLYILTGGLTFLLLIPIYQAFMLKTYYKSKSSLFGAFVFLNMGGRQLYSFVRLKHNISEAKLQGIMIDHLSLEQWLVAVVWAYLIAIGFIIWLHWKRNDLKKLGI